jgi:transcriptional regulator with XRE-family HTH domain
METKKPKKTVLCEYYRAYLIHPETKERHFINVHRLMALVFLPIPKKYLEQGLTEKDLVPNHKDGVKLHNAIYNLEWSTYSENTQHAYANDLMRHNKANGEPAEYITESQARNIAELIQKGFSNKEISEMTGIGTNIIHSIKGRKSWKKLTDDYVFIRTVDSIPFSISDEIILNICKDILGGKMTGKQISEKYGVTRSYVSEIKNHNIRPDLTKDMDFTKRANLPKRQNDKLIHELCKDLQDGIKASKLTKKYGVSMSFVSEVKHGKIRPDISKEYTF